jgi:uncharacterized DUF497 family protein
MTARFTWDRAKAESNKRKHGIEFDEATAVFFDEFALSEQDRIEGYEYRWQTIGSMDGWIIVTVAHTIFEDDDVEIIHIISARPATRRERKRYEQAGFGHLRG